MVSRKREPGNHLIGLIDLVHDDPVTGPMRGFGLGRNDGRERHVNVGNGAAVITFRRLED